MSDPAEFTLQERLRTAHVTRWQIVRTARAQTVAEHLYLVWVLTRAFARAAKFSPEDCALAEEWALNHDVPEVRTGDLATPVKRAMREAVPHDDPIRRIELAMSDSYRDLYAQVKERPWVKKVVKLADILEATLFTQTEGIGKHAIRVEGDLWVAFHAILAEASLEHPYKETGFLWTHIYDIAVNLYQGEGL